MVGLGDVAFVSKHPSLWKPGAAGPKPSNKVQCGSGWKALSGASEEAGKGEGADYSILQAGGLGLPPWLGWWWGDRKERGQDQAGPERLRPRDKGRDRQRESRDSKMQRHQKAETPSERGRCGKEEEDKNWSELWRPLRRLAGET